MKYLPLLNERLFDAVKKEKIKNVSFLLNIGADIEAKDRFGKNVLMYANSYEMVEFLIERGAEVEARDYNGKRALMYAKNSEVAKALIKNGADVNARDDAKRTALMYAKNKEVAEILVKNGAEIKKRDIGDLDVLMLNNDALVVDFLVGCGLCADYVNSNLQTPLMFAINKDKAEILLKNGADVNKCDAKGDSVLINVVKRGGDYEVVKFLVENGADVDLKNKEGKKAFDYAKDEEVKKVLGKHMKKDFVMDKEREIWRW